MWLLNSSEKRLDALEAEARRRNAELDGATRTAFAAALVAERDAIAIAVAEILVREAAMAKLPSTPDTLTTLAALIRDAAPVKLSPAQASELQQTVRAKADGITGPILISPQTLGAARPAPSTTIR